MKPTVEDPENARLDKLFKYFDHFNIEERYGIDFKEFVRRVDEDLWDAYLG